MINLDLSTLNPLEKKIHKQMIRHSRTMPGIKINQAAELCQCSGSKISKFVKKLGFSSYRQYLDFLYGREIPPAAGSDELGRVKSFIDTFDNGMVDDLLTLIDGHGKIIFFGYGPSLLCARYFEYRFHNCSDKPAMAVSDEVTLNNLVDDTTLLLILTETGRFKSFEPVYERAKRNGATVVILVEEYNTDLFNQCDNIFWLSRTAQPAHLKPYEKSRTLFFIFLEEIIQRLLVKKE
jgi:DNA-binding MurR/RpiR family transcriptional regulator